MFKPTFRSISFDKRFKPGRMILKLAINSIVSKYATNESMMRL